MTDTKKLRVLHLDSEKTWRGGENQMRLLIEGSSDIAESYLACPEDSVAARRLGDQVTLFPAKFNFPGIFSSAKKLATEVEKHHIDIIDCQSSKAHNMGILIKKHFPKVKLVVHRRVDFAPSQGFFNRKKYLNYRVDKYISISNAISNILANYGIAPHKLATVRSATDSGPFQKLDHMLCRKEVCDELKIDERVPLILNVAYHTPQKGLPTLLEAIKHMVDDGLKFVCLLAGDGELRSMLEEQAKKFGIDGSFLHFLGIRKDIPRLMVASDVFVLPSNFEGLGTSILDAIHSGCAVAASEIGGIPEMIKHGKTGLLSPVGDSRALASNLEDLISDQKYARKLVINAQRHISQEFSIHQMVEGNLKIYQELIKN